MNERLDSDYHSAREILRLCLLPALVAVEGKFELFCALAEAPAADILFGRQGSVFRRWEPLHSQLVLSPPPGVYGSERNKPNGRMLSEFVPEWPKYRCAHLYSRVCVDRTSSRSCSLQWYNYINNATFFTRNRQFWKEQMKPNFLGNVSIYMVRTENYELTLSHLDYFPSTWPKTLRWIWINLQVLLQKFTKNNILVKDIWKNSFIH
jgi:hypothetical protein